MEEYTSLIVDIKKSRKYEIKERNELQEYLVNCVQKLNCVFQKTIICNVTFSAGDELQGLFADTVAAVMYLRLLDLMAKPVQLRAGIGIGGWNVKIVGGLSTEQDGPAYHNARHAIEKVYKMQTQRFCIYSEKREDAIANHLLNASMSLSQNQIYMQNMVLLILEFLYPFVNGEPGISEYQCIKDLLVLKCNYPLGKQKGNHTARGKNLEAQVLKAENLYIREVINIVAEIKDAEGIVIKKNMAINIAEVIGTTRQNINAVMKRGNAIFIRSMDYMALQYIKINYGGSHDL